MIRAGSGIILLSVLLYFLAGQLVPDAPPDAGANIGAGLVVLFVFFVFLVGAALTIAGIIRWLVVRIRTIKAKR